MSVCLKRFGGNMIQLTPIKDRQLKLIVKIPIIMKHNYETCLAVGLLFQQIFKLLSNNMKIKFHWVNVIYSASIYLRKVS